MVTLNETIKSFSKQKKHFLCVVCMCESKSTVNVCECFLSNIQIICQHLNISM